MVTIVPASHEDSPFLLAWRNDPVSIAASITPSRVEPADHDAWFARVLADIDRRILIARDRSGARLGMVRFDRSDGIATVSINLAPETRGRRLSVPVLQAGIEAIIGEWGRPLRLVAEIREENAASIALFERVGFILIGTGNGVRRYALDG